MNHVLANLRHLYEHLVNGTFNDPKELADGLLSPAIKHIEKMAEKKEAIARIIDPKSHNIFDEDCKRTKGVTLEKMNVIGKITLSREKADDILVLLGIIKKIDYVQLAKGMYTKYTDSDPIVHSNRFPSWDELDQKYQNKWIEDAKKSINGNS